MKILVFEYIAGGGFNRQGLPASLANEGLLMLGALIDSLTELPDLEITIMLDWRLTSSLNRAGINTVITRQAHDCHEQFVRLAEVSDAVWPVAPEFDGLLHKLCLSVETLGKILLASTADAVALTADKFRTFQHLNRHRIPTVATRLFNDCREYPGECIVKPIDGAGCANSYVIINPEDFAPVSAKLHGTGSYIVQPHINGTKTSLSGLFKEGKIWLLSANLQKFKLVNNQYHLSEIIVNHHSDLASYQELAAGVAEAIPGLWGYAGIDLIETPGTNLVLEINPRLTTSFAGLNAALGINVAALVLQLLRGEPVILRKANRRVTVKIKQEHHEF